MKYTLEVGTYARLRKVGLNHDGSSKLEFADYQEFSVAVASATEAKVKAKAIIDEQRSKGRFCSIIRRDATGFGKSMQSFSEFASQIA